MLLCELSKNPTSYPLNLSRGFLFVAKKSWVRGNCVNKNVFCDARLAFCFSHAFFGGSWEKTVDNDSEWQKKCRVVSNMISLLWLLSLTCSGLSVTHGELPHTLWIPIQYPTLHFSSLQAASERLMHCVLCSHYTRTVGVFHKFSFSSRHGNELGEC